MATWRRGKTNYILIASAPLVASAGAASAQRTAIERVRFEAGRTTAVLRGSVSGRTGRVYLVHARKGQYMTVHLSGQKGPVFDISSPDHTGFSMLQGRDWEGELPLTGAYRIHVEGEVESLPARGYALEMGGR